MSCCGGKRAAASAAATTRPVKFEYRGERSLTVVGSATRKLYWFAGPGAHVDIHARDAESLEGVTHLTRLEGH